MLVYSLIHRFCVAIEGYYDHTSVHRIIKDFMVQFGDPSGTGEGGESIWGKPFKDEIHGRIKFNHRGQVAMANENKPNTNHSQFFITLSSCPHLDRKHTIFGKVTGTTIYNLMKLNEVEIDSKDRPVEPIKIHKMEILLNPFDDIVPRDISHKKYNETVIETAPPPVLVVKKDRKGVKDNTLLSFEEDEAGTLAGDGNDAFEAKMREKMLQKRRRVEDKPEITTEKPPIKKEEQTDAAHDHDTSQLKEANKEYQRLRDELLRSKRSVQLLTGEIPKDSVSSNNNNDDKKSFLEQQKLKYMKRKSDDGGDRQNETMLKLQQFKQGLKQVKKLESAPVVVESYHGQVLEGNDEDKLDNWYGGKLTFKKHAMDDQYRFGLGGDGRHVDDYEVVDSRK